MSHDTKKGSVSRTTAILVVVGAVVAAIGIGYVMLLPGQITPANPGSRSPEPRVVKSARGVVLSPTEIEVDAEIHRIGRLANRTARLEAFRKVVEQHDGSDEMWTQVMVAHARSHLAHYAKDTSEKIRILDETIRRHEGEEDINSDISHLLADALIRRANLMDNADEALATLDGIIERFAASEYDATQREVILAHCYKAQKIKNLAERLTTIRQGLELYPESRSKRVVAAKVYSHYLYAFYCEGRKQKQKALEELIEVSRRGGVHSEKGRELWAYTQLAGLTDDAAKRNDMYAEIIKLYRDSDEEDASEKVRSIIEKLARKDAGASAVSILSGLEKDPDTGIAMAARIALLSHPDAPDAAERVKHLYRGLADGEYDADTIRELCVKSDDMVKILSDPKDKAAVHRAVIAASRNGSFKGAPTFYYINATSLVDILDDEEEKAAVLDGILAHSLEKGDADEFSWVLARVFRQRKELAGGDAAVEAFHDQVIAARKSDAAVVFSLRSKVEDTEEKSQKIPLIEEIIRIHTESEDDAFRREVARAYMDMARAVADRDEAGQWYGKILETISEPKNRSEKYLLVRATTEVADRTDDDGKKRALYENAVNAVGNDKDYATDSGLIQIVKRLAALTDDTDMLRQHYTAYIDKNPNTYETPKALAGLAELADSDEEKLALHESAAEARRGASDYARLNARLKIIKTLSDPDLKVKLYNRIFEEGTQQANPKNFTMLFQEMMRSELSAAEKKKILDQFDTVDPELIETTLRSEMLLAKADLVTEKDEKMALYGAVLALPADKGFVPFNKRMAVRKMRDLATSPEEKEKLRQQVEKVFPGEGKELLDGQAFPFRREPSLSERFKETKTPEEQTAFLAQVLTEWKDSDSSTRSVYDLKNIATRADQTAWEAIVPLLREILEKSREGDADAVCTIATTRMDTRASARERKEIQSFLVDNVLPHLRPGPGTSSILKVIPYLDSGEEKVALYDEMIEAFSLESDSLSSLAGMVNARNRIMNDPDLEARAFARALDGISDGQFLSNIYFIVDKPELFEKFKPRATEIVLETLRSGGIDALPMATPFVIKPLLTTLEGDEEKRAFIDKAIAAADASGHIMASVLIDNLYEEKLKFLGNTEQRLALVDERIASSTGDPNDSSANRWLILKSSIVADPEEKKAVYEKMIANAKGHPSYYANESLGEALMEWAESQAGREEQIAAYDTIIGISRNTLLEGRMYSHSNPAALKAAKAKATLLGNDEEIMALYDATIANARQPKDVIALTMRKVGDCESNEQGAAMLDALLARYKNETDHDIIVSLADALMEKAFRSDDLAAKRLAYAELIARHGESPYLDLQTRVVKAREYLAAISVDDGEKQALWDAIEASEMDLNNHRLWQTYHRIRADRIQAADTVDGLRELLVSGSGASPSRIAERLMELDADDETKKTFVREMRERFWNDEKEGMVHGAIKALRVEAAFLPDEEQKTAYARAREDLESRSLGLATMKVFYKDFLDITGDDKPLRETYHKQIETTEKELGRLELRYTLAKELGDTAEQLARGDEILGLPDDDWRAGHLADRVWWDRVDAAEDIAEKNRLLAAKLAQETKWYRILPILEKQAELETDAAAKLAMLNDILEKSAGESFPESVYIQALKMRMKMEK